MYYVKCLLCVYYATYMCFVFTEFIKIICILHLINNKEKSFVSFSAAF